MARPKDRGWEFGGMWPDEDADGGMSYDQRRAQMLDEEFDQWQVKATAAEEELRQRSRRNREAWGMELRTDSSHAGHSRHDAPEGDLFVELRAWDPMGRRQRRNEGFGDDVPLHATLTDADIGVNVVRVSRHAEEGIGGHGPLTHADIGVKVYRGG